MKLLVETVGDFQLMDADPFQIMHFNRPTVVVRSVFVEQRILTGQLRVLAQLADTASDEDWMEHSKEAGDDRDYSVESYKSQHKLPKGAPELQLPNVDVPADPALRGVSVQNGALVDNTTPADQTARSYPSEPRKPGEASQAPAATAVEVAKEATDGKSSKK